MPRVDKQREQGTPTYAKPHACLSCAATFGQKSTLTRHVSTVHEKRRDHVCPYCPKAFGQKSTLTKHVSTVHEKRRDHACPHCPKAFGRVDNLRRHVRSQHPSNAQDDVAGHSSQPGAAARILSADYIVDALLSR